MKRFLNFFVGFLVTDGEGPEIVARATEAPGSGMIDQRARQIEGGGIFPIRNVLKDDRMIWPEDDPRGEIFPLHPRLGHGGRVFIREIGACELLERGLGFREIHVVRIAVAAAQSESGDCDNEASCQ